MVNYCPKDKTVISKSEIEYREEPGFLYEIAYFVSGADKELVVATTRPETLLAIWLSPSIRRINATRNSSERLLFLPYR